MEKWRDKPLGFGEILDVTFRITKQHFSKLFLIMIILTGPMYIVESLALVSGGTAILPDPVEEPSLDSFLERLESGEMEEDWTNFGTTQFSLLMGVEFLLNIISFPLAEASILLAIDRIRKNEPFHIWQIIRQAFTRFWALLGGTILYFLLIFVLLAGLSILIIPFLLLFGDNMGLTAILAAVLLGGVYLLGMVYLLTRWSYYFAAILFEKVSPGFRKSWHLTRGSFWRLVGLYIVLTIITSIISIVFQAPLETFLTQNIISTLLSNLVTMLTTMIFFIGYAVVYFDLRIRNEATDLEAMVEQYHAQAPLKESSDEETREENKEDDGSPPESDK